MPPKKRGKKKGGAGGRKKKKALTPQEQFHETMANCLQRYMPTYLPPDEYPIWEVMSDNEDDNDEDGDDDNNDMEPGPTLVHKDDEDDDVDDLPALENLVGTYELVFYYSRHSEPEWKYSRATKGRLHLEIVVKEGNGQKDRKKSFLKGRVVVDDSVKKDLEPHYVDWEFKVLKTYSTSTLKLQITNSAEDFWVEWQAMALQDAQEAAENDDDDDDGDGGGGGGCIEGYVNVLASRHALRFMPEKQLLENGSLSPERLALEIKHAKSIKFETNQETEALLTEFEKNRRYPWLENYLNLPEKVSHLIYQFASLKPAPVLFLEKNDLHLEFDWANGENEGLKSHLFARRQTAQE